MVKESPNELEVDDLIYFLKKIKYSLKRLEAIEKDLLRFELLFNNFKTRINNEKV